MKKTIGLIIMLIIILITLTGCAEVNYEVEVNQDGSANITYTYNISKKESANSIEMLKEILETKKKEAEKEGYTVEKFEDDEKFGFKANKYTDNISKDFSLETPFGEENIKDIEENKINIEKSFWSTKYSQNAELDLANLKDTEIEMTYKIKLPAKTRTNNANEVSENGRELIWNLKSGETNKIEFVAEQINIMPIIIIAGVSIAIVVAISATIIIILTKKHVTKKED